MRKGDRLELIGKLRQRSVWPAAKLVAAGGELSAPIVVDLDPTTFCDLACPECISGSLLNKGSFTKERLHALAGEIAAAGVRAVILIGGGEPLLHTGIDRTIEILKSHGIAIGLVTNGTLIARHLEVLARSIDWVRVSIDAACSQTYQRIRPARNGRSMFRTVLRNMKALARVKCGALGYSFLVITRGPMDLSPSISNVKEIFQAARYAKRIGCDYIEVKAALDMNHHVVLYTQEEVGVLSEEIARAMEIADSSFEVLV